MPLMKLGYRHGSLTSSQIASRGASIAMDSSTRIASAEHREDAVAGHVVEGRLHAREHVVVNGVQIGPLAELLTQMHGVEDAHADLRRQRQVAGHVADV